MQQQQAISQPDCDVQRKVDFYVTTGNNQLSGRTEKKLQITSKAKLAPDKGHDFCLLVCCLSDAL